MQASHMSSKMRKQRASGSRHAGHAGSPRLTSDLDVRVGVFRQPAMQTPVLEGTRRMSRSTFAGAASAGAGAEGRRTNRRGTGSGVARGADECRDAERDSAAGIPQDSAPDAGAFAEEYFAARSELVPVLRRGADCRRTHAGSCDSAVAGRRVDLGEPGCLLPRLQSAQGQSVAA